VAGEADIVGLGPSSRISAFAARADIFERLRRTSGDSSRARGTYFVDVGRVRSVERVARFADKRDGFGGARRAGGLPRGPGNFSTAEMRFLRDMHAMQAPSRARQRGRRCRGTMVHCSPVFRNENPIRFSKPIRPAPARELSHPQDARGQVDYQMTEEKPGTLALGDLVEGQRAGTFLWLCLIVQGYPHRRPGASDSSASRMGRYRHSSLRTLSASALGLGGRPGAYHRAGGSRHTRVEAPPRHTYPLIVARMWENASGRIARELVEANHRLIHAKKAGTRPRSIDSPRRAGPFWVGGASALDLQSPAPRPIEDVGLGIFSHGPGGPSARSAPAGFRSFLSDSRLCSAGAR